MQITQAEFDRRLLEKFKTITVDELVNLPGVLEILSRYLINEVLRECESFKEAE